MSDPLHVAAALGAIYLLGIALAFWCGRRWERKRISQQHNEGAFKKRWACGQDHRQHTQPPPAFRTCRPMFRRPNA